MVSPLFRPVPAGNCAVVLQAFDSRLFGLGGSQSNRFVPLLSAETSATLNGKKKGGGRALPRQNGHASGMPPRPPTAPPQVCWLQCLRCGTHLLGSPPGAPPGWHRAVQLYAYGVT